MTRRIQTLITAWALLLAAVVSLFVLPSFSYAEEGQWVYDSSAQTLTSETQGVTLNNVQVNGNGQLTIGNNGSASFASLDLTGSIIDASDPEATYSVVAISSAAFFESQLETVVLPDSITEIGDYAFEDSESLQSVTLPKGLTSIPIFMFEGCSSLASIAIPDSVTYIGNSAFAYCTSLTSVELPENLTSIDSDAFSNCTSLASIDIPRNVSSIADHVFENCKALESITLPDGLTTIESFTFNNCTSLESVQFPSTLITISGSAFSNCGSLEVVDIPSGVTTIGADAFRNCTALSSITLPENVTNIGAQAFGGCSSMIGITVLSTTPPALSETAFSDCNAIRMICVPASVLSEYKTADGWTSFADKLEGVYKLTVVNGVDSGWYPTG